MRSYINPNFSYELMGTPPHNWIIEQHTDSHYLIITVGDSWTWGNFLCNSGYVNPNPGKFFDDYDFRSKHVYGYHLHKKTNFDWINLAICGSDNITMIDLCWKFIKTLDRSYKKIFIILTLTEIGRELTGKNFLLQQEGYENLKGCDWPDFFDLVNHRASQEKIDFFRKECVESELQIIYAYELYQALQPSMSVTEMLEKYEKYTFELISKLLTGPNISCTVARNFVDNFANNTTMKNLRFMDKKWTDVIAENGNLSPYPNGIRLLGGVAIGPVTQYVETHRIGTKQEMLELFNSSAEALDWLDRSPYNHQENNYRHPGALAHEWWADYLYKNVDWQQ